MGRLAAQALLRALLVLAVLAVAMAFAPSSPARSRRQACMPARKLPGGTMLRAVNPQVKSVYRMTLRRPKKTRPSDKERTPLRYRPDPTDDPELPPEYTVIPRREWEAKNGPIDFDKEVDPYVTRVRKGSLKLKT